MEYYIKQKDWEILYIALIEGPNNYSETKRLRRFGHVKTTNDLYSLSVLIRINTNIRKITKTLFRARLNYFTGIIQTITGHILTVYNKDGHEIIGIYNE